ncbi:MAG: hypothetical protein OXO50_05975 [Caldilineaceae bacterium]|nr:hypothetical protein [Caldilineaceae bacterium]
MRETEIGQPRGNALLQAWFELGGGFRKPEWNSPEADERQGMHPNSGVGTVWKGIATSGG